MAEITPAAISRTKVDEKLEAIRARPPYDGGADWGTSLEAAQWAASLLRLSVAEALWTTRCIICDSPTTLLCERCRKLLPFIDRWDSCPRCGAANGRLVCTECNSFSLAEQGLKHLPFDGCASAISHTGPARALVTAYKDRGEQRLAKLIAELLFLALPEPWLLGVDALAFVPADQKARRRRGFDHMLLVAQEFSELSGIPVRCLLAKKPVPDQRGLSRSERIGNMMSALEIADAWRGRLPARILLLDDVLTTGATLLAATRVLKEQGASTVYCASFARTS